MNHPLAQRSLKTRRHEEDGKTCPAAEGRNGPFASRLRAFVSLWLIFFSLPAVAEDWPARVDPRAQLVEGRVDRHPPTGCTKPSYSWNPLHWAVEEAAQKAWCEGRATIEALTVEDIQRIKTQGQGDPRAILAPGAAGIPGIGGGNHQSGAATR